MPAFGKMTTRVLIALPCFLMNGSVHKIVHSFVREIFLCFEIICIGDFFEPFNFSKKFRNHTFSTFSSRKCTIHMISKQRKISLTSEVFYFMDPLYIYEMSITHFENHKLAKNLIFKKKIKRRITGSQSPRQTTGRVSSATDSPRLTNRYRGIIGGRLQDKVNSSVQEDTISRWEKSRRGKKFLMNLVYFYGFLLSHLTNNFRRSETAVSTYFRL